MAGDYAAGQAVRAELKIDGEVFKICFAPALISYELKESFKELAEAEEKLTKALAADLPDILKAEGVRGAVAGFAKTLLDLLGFLAGRGCAEAVGIAFGEDYAKLCAELMPFFANELMPEINRRLSARRNELLTRYRFGADGFLNPETRFMGRRVKLRLSFDRVLRAYEIWREPLLSDAEKLTTVLKLLVKNYRVARMLAKKCKWRLLEDIFGDFIMGDNGGSAGGEKYFDFERDAGYIYSSFMLDYGIDLYRERGKLSWRKFLALFQGLSENAKLSRVINIRAAKIPSEAKLDSAEAEELIRLKEYYALKLPGREKEERFQDALGRLAEVLERAGEAVGKNHRSDVKEQEAV